MAVPSNIISPLFAEPNLPQQYTESLGAPFGDRYVYTIFMQGINALPDIPSSAEGSELTARIKEVDGNNYRIMEYYYVKQEGEWVADGDDQISSWTEEEESSGGGGIVWLRGNEADGVVYLVDNSGKSVTYNDVNGWVNEGKLIVTFAESTETGFVKSFYWVDFIGFSSVENVYAVDDFRASTPDAPLTMQAD